MDTRRHPLEDLNDMQLEEIAGYSHPFTPQHRDAVAQRFRGKVAAERGRRAPRRVAAVLVAAAVVALAGFAGADRIQRLFAAQFGAGSGLDQYAADVGAVSTDQGIRMEVLTALNDGEDTYLFVDLTDKTGSRLDDRLFVDSWDLWVENGGDIMGGNCRLHSYDTAAGTATLAVHGIGTRPGAQAVFRITSLYLGEVNFDFTADTLDLAGLVEKQSGGFRPWDKSGGFGGGTSMEFMEAGLELHDIEEVLVPDSMHTEIPGYGKGYLSAIAWRNGQLHIQTNMDNDPGNEALMLTLVHRESGAVLSSFYTNNYGEYERDGNTYSNDYQETVFRIGRDALADYDLHLYGWYYEEVLTGDWAVGFTTPDRMETRSAAAGALPAAVGALTVDELTVSPLSVNLLVRAEAAGDLSIGVLYRNGSTRQARLPLSGGGETALRFEGPFPDFADIEAVLVEDVRIPLE